jgi:hypothetical protein
VVHTVSRHELTGQLVAGIPARLCTSERTCVGVALGLEIEDGVDSVSRATIADSDHDRVLVRAHDVCDAIEHRFPFVRGSSDEGPL